MDILEELKELAFDIDMMRFMPSCASNRHLEIVKRAIQYIEEMRNGKR